MRNPYTVLGIARGATDEDIKSAYRGLAKKFHPDLNPGKKEIEQKFKEINAAYDILSDPEKRAKFDRGDMDASGQERQQQNWRRSSSFHRQHEGSSEFGDFEPEDIFADLFGGSRARGSHFSSQWGKGEDPFAGAKSRARGGDLQVTLHVSFVEAAMGAKKRVVLPTGKTIEVAVPPATENMKKLRLKGQGHPSPEAGAGGDAIVEIHVAAHPFFTAKGQDILLDLPVTFYEATLGATVPAPTLDGTVEVKIPKGSNSGTVLRLRGKGMPDPQGVRGDQYVKLKVMLPEGDETFTKFAEKWSSTYDPRKKAGMV